MGISTLKSYCGAQIFDAVGISEDVIDKYFPDVVVTDLVDNLKRGKNASTAVVGTVEHCLMKIDSTDLNTRVRAAVHILSNANGDSSRCMMYTYYLSYYFKMILICHYVSNLRLS